ncbi:helix-turn-helix transcriptional regulator [Pseudoalteromonas sp. SR43-6]|jgi:putative transcriptional regulator|uniref:helix-turn-helix transcriptional regulator n=1 Tax=Pseudoalteromonas TaxID=53246 RepID=UPI000427FF9E|nr:MULTISPECIES: helix-turn-helix transcriptional regulator [Pseudoalteromonas]MBB1282123.1 helix-turn-helix transcriptional regulator [Pseudoalteromonas sp. SR41-1]MBB1290592.1 helix-turn-helix transcriptional regulator [Pseudoalteromonas sp. SR41-5]MBB1330691.1 helix-turn-helix transcriptional regulator [Pseudoalteromonas sp. SR43-7]MBB1375923.1 helix-turn-helix transcriptional regulator [Pseudoalteromonas sp. SR43-6]MBB1379605.1 helix-turn-helix transcriptional regulator [Pseudoalteromonas 
MQNNIAKYRKEAGLSQQELADAINVSRKTISTVETNRFTPSVIIALKIAKHFNTSVESLFVLDKND